jgi:transposase-like protein
MNARVQRILAELEAERAAKEAYLNSPELKAYQAAVIKAHAEGEIAIQCGDCHHVDKWSKFETARDRFQCPKCKSRFAIEYGPVEVLENGFVKPASKKLVRLIPEAKAP